MTESKLIHARISVDLIEQAREYDINISKACRDGIQKAIEREQKIRELGL